MGKSKEDNEESKELAMKTRRNISCFVLKVKGMSLLFYTWIFGIYCVG